MNDRRLISALAVLACSYPATAWAHGGWQGFSFLLSLLAVFPLTVCALIMGAVLRFSAHVLARRVVAGVGGVVGALGGAWMVFLQGLELSAGDVDWLTAEGLVMALVTYTVLALVFFLAYRLWRPVEGAEAG